MHFLFLFTCDVYFYEKWSIVCYVVVILLFLPIKGSIKHVNGQNCCFIYLLLLSFFLNFLTAYSELILLVVLCLKTTGQWIYTNIKAQDDNHNSFLKFQIYSQDPAKNVAPWYWSNYSCFEINSSISWNT